MPRFSVNDRVLVPQGWNSNGRIVYCPADVVSVNVEEQEDGEEYHETLTVVYDAEGIDDDNDEDRVEEILDHPAFTDNVLPLTPENLIQQLSSLVHLTRNLDLESRSQEEIIRYLKLAVESRSLESLVFIAIHRRQIPYRALGTELLRLALTPVEIPLVRLWDDLDQDAYAWCSDLHNLLSSINEVCGAPVTSFRVTSTLNSSTLQEVEDGMDLEHVAAMRGDTKLLTWMLERNQRQFRSRLGASRLPRDAHGATPLHYAVQNGHVSIVHVYRHLICSNVMSNVYIPDIEDFDAQDEWGRTVHDLATVMPEGTEEKDEMLTAVHELQRMIYQTIVNRALYRSTDSVLDYEYLQTIVTRFNLHIGSMRHGDDFGLRTLFQACEKGDLKKLQWLLMTMKVGDYTSRDPSDNRLSLLHTAARLDSGTWLCMEHRRERTDSGHRDWEQQTYLRDWDGVTSLEEYTKKFRSSFIQSPLDSWVASIEKSCGNQNLAEKRVAVVQWLLYRGLTLPDCKFLVEECDYATAKKLLQYRLDVDSVIDNLLHDRAPQAMDLVKEYLYGNAQTCDVSVDPKSVALLCVQRFSRDTLNERDLCRLKLLQWIIKRYDVDPTKVLNADGDTILHDAVRNKCYLITSFLSANYRPLVYKRGLSGKLPVHLALEETGNDRIMGDLVLRFTSELIVGKNSSFGDWYDDERVWLLSDQRGRTVRDYALSCEHESIRDFALQANIERCRGNLLRMIADESTTVSDVVDYCQKSHLEDQIRERSDNRKKFALLHETIGFGRLDLLCWFDTFYSDVDSLPRKLTSKDFQGMPMIPIVCHPIVQLEVSDLVEVSCTFRIHTEDIMLSSGQRVTPSMFDGEWEIQHWMPKDDSSVTMMIYDLRGVADFPGMPHCSLKILENGEVEARFEIGDLVDCWRSSPLVQGPVAQLQLRRVPSFKLFGRSFIPTERMLIMTKIADMGASVPPPTTWRLARVAEKKENNILVSYASVHPSCEGMDSSQDEWIPKSSDRINRSGVLRLEYTPGMYLYSRNDEPSLPLVTGREFAMKCGQKEVVEWIDSVDALANIKKKLTELDKEFLMKFVTDGPNEHLEKLILEGRRVLKDSRLTIDMLESLEATLYVLDRCWSQQPEPKWLDIALEEETYHKDLHGLGLFGIASALGRVGRINWILDTGRLPLDSPHLRTATVTATEVDCVDIVRELVARGVDMRANFIDANFRVLPDDEAVSQRSLIEIAVEQLCGKVACFLLDSDLVPDDHISTSLLTKCAGSVYAYRKYISEQASEKAGYRAAIAERLCLRGVRPDNSNNSSESTMLALLQTIELASSEVNDRREYVQYVPATFEVMQILCKFGGDIVSAFTDHSLEPHKKKEFPTWLINYIERIKADEEIFEIVSASSSDCSCSDTLEEYFHMTGRDANTVRDRCNRSLLQVSAASGNVKLVEWLIESGADVNEVDMNGYTIRDLCLQLGHAELVELLDSLGSGEEDVNDSEE